MILGARGIGGNEGGLEKFAEEFVRRVAGSCRVTLLSLSGRKPDGIADIELVLSPRSKIMRTDKIFYYTRAAWICLTRRFDHVVLLGLNAAMFLLPLRLLFWRRVNIVVRSGSVDYLLDKWGLLSKLYFKQAEGLLQFADLVVSVSPSIQRHLARRGIPSVIIPNGLRLTTALRPLAERDRRHVVAVGRVTPQKNYRVLVEAARLLRDCGVRVSIIGGADLSGESTRLRVLADEIGATNVNFAGVMYRESVLECLSAASLFVNCSIHEGMSNSVLEAIQQGTPVLLADIEANRDLDLPETFYFDPGSPNDLSAKIERALQAPADFLVSREHFHDWDDIVEKYRCYMSLPR